MLETSECNGKQETSLYFGFAVVPLMRKRSRESVMGRGFHAILFFHKLYSVALLRAAVAKLCASR